MRSLLLAALLAGCQVDLGTAPDAARCAPSPDFFVDPLWLQFFDANGCAMSDCHAASDGHGYLRFQPPGAMPAPGTAFADWPPSWRANYQAAIPLVRCDDFRKSRLLTVPEGAADPHPPGDKVGNHAAAEALFGDWAAR
jgi:hypothetical protein